MKITNYIIIYLRLHESLFVPSILDFLVLGVCREESFLLSQTVRDICLFRTGSANLFSFTLLDLPSFDPLLEELELSLAIFAAASLNLD